MGSYICDYVTTMNICNKKNFLFVIAVRYRYRYNRMRICYELWISGRKRCNAQAWWCRYIFHLSIFLAFCVKACHYVSLCSKYIMRKELLQQRRLVKRTYKNTRGTNLIWKKHYSILYLLLNTLRNVNSTSTCRIS